MVKKRRSRGSESSGSPFFLLVIIAALVAVVYFFLKFSPNVSTDKFSRFGRYSFVVRTSPMLVVSFVPKEAKAFVFKIPNDLYVKSMHGYGQIRASEVYRAGELDKRGNLVLLDTVSDMLGIDVSAVFTGPERLLDQNDKINRLAFTQSSYWKQMNLGNFSEMIEIAKTWTTLRSDKVVVVDLSSPRYSSETVMEDGSTVTTLDLDRVDSFVDSNLTTTAMNSENLRVGVVNTTSTNGLGATGARFLTNAGMLVVSVESWLSGIADCEIQYSDAKTKSSKSFLFASEIFSCRGTLNSELDNRFDMLIILGSKFDQKYQK